MKVSVPPRLRRGDRIRFISPASRPDPDAVRRGAALVGGWGLKVEFGRHAFDAMGHYLAGSDEARVADLNEALRDPGVRAILCTLGGKGSYRIAHQIDFEAARHDPKPLVGFSDITTLHLALWKEAGVVGLHGPLMAWQDEWYGPRSAESLRQALMEDTAITLHRDPEEPTSAIRIEGTATGILLGGSLGMIAKSVGWACPSFAGGILFIEAGNAYLGEIDSSLTQLMRSGVLEGVRGVAVGQFSRCGEPPGLFARFRRQARARWTCLDVLRDRLAALDVPVLGGLPLGHGRYPRTVPLGTTATIDVAQGTLCVEAGVR